MSTELLTTCHVSLCQHLSGTSVCIYNSIFLHAHATYRTFNWSATVHSRQPPISFAALLHHNTLVTPLASHRERSVTREDVYLAFVLLFSRVAVYATLLARSKRHFGQFTHQRHTQHSIFAVYLSVCSGIRLHSAPQSCHRLSVMSISLQYLLLSLSMLSLSSVYL